MRGSEFQVFCTFRRVDCAASQGNLVVARRQETYAIDSGPVAVWHCLGRDNRAARRRAHIARNLVWVEEIDVVTLRGRNSACERSKPEPLIENADSGFER